MAVDFATLALRVENADAVRKMDDMGAAIERVDKKTASHTVTTEGARKAWAAAGGDMKKFGQELQKMLGVTEQAAPATNRFRESIDRMRKSAEQAKATRFHEELQKIEARAAQATARTNGLADAMRKMRAAAEQGRANAMASMIQASDPFQAVGKIAENAPKAALNLSRLRGSMTGLAIAASGVAGPVGSFASTLGMMTAGAPIMIGVLAGVAALGFAWDRLTRKAREAKKAQEEAVNQLLDLAKQQERGPFSFDRSALSGAWNQALSASADIRRIESTPGYTYGTDVRGKDILLDRARAKQQEAMQAIAAAQRDTTRVTEEETDRRIAAAVREAAEAKRLADARRALFDYESGLIDAKTSLPGIRQPMRFNDPNKAITGQIGTEVSAELGRYGNLMAANLATAARIAIVVKQVTDKQERMTNAKGMAIGAATSFLSNHMGSVGGGILAGGINGFQAAGPMGAAIGAGSAFIDTVIGMGDASRRAAENIRQMKFSLEDTLLGWEASLGNTAAGKEQRRNRVIEESRQAQADAKAIFGSAFVRGDPNALERYKAEIDRIKAIETARLDALDKEKGAIDELTRSMVNMVEGYKLQATIFKYANPRGPSTPPPVPVPPSYPTGSIPPGGPGETGTGIPGAGSGNLTVEVVMNGEKVGTAVIRDFRRRASDQTGDSTNWTAITA